LTGEAVIRSARAVFWDFDGVIKESTDLKTRAFVRLFESFGADVADRVRAHHEANGGISRFDKLPLYLRYAGEEPTAERIDDLSERFGTLVRQAVIDAPWVPGAESYLRRNPRQQIFVVMSATPQAELTQIVESIGLTAAFSDVVGAPMTKSDAIRRTLARYAFKPAECVAIGDTTADRDAAGACGVPFVLRRHPSNAGLFTTYQGPSIEDLTRL
jgi:phosphoglycolate phosphatase-like HAD superfamily hydrolase